MPSQSLHKTKGMGRFITLEGGEGVGKTTNRAFIADWLAQQGIDFIETREPGGTELAEKIRQLLLDTDNKGMPAQTELLLMYAARAAHLQEKIIPALTAGKWVLCDRFFDATHAYQGAGRACDHAFIAQLDQAVIGRYTPDLTLLLDLEPEVGMQRAGKRGAADRFEQETLSFFEKVRAAYLARAKQGPERLKVIDAALPLPAVQQQIADVLNSVLENEFSHAQHAPHV